MSDQPEHKPCPPEILSRDNSREASLFSLIGQIYEAVQRAELWRAFLDSLTRRLKGQSSALILHDESQWQSHVTVAAGLDPALAKEYNEYYSSVNPWSLRGKQFEHVGGVYTGQMAISDSEFEETEYYRDYLRRTGLFHTIAGTISVGENLRSWVTTLRPKGMGQFGPDEIVDFQLLVPHLQRARELNRDLALLKAERDAAAGALDRLWQGCFLLDNRGKVILFNRAAEAILERKDGLRLVKGTVVADRTEESRQLRMLVMSSLSRSGAGGMIAISRPSLKRPYLARVTRLHKTTFDLGKEQAYAALFVVDPEIQPQSEEELLKAAYGLTRAEAGLANLLMQGLGMEEAAEHLGIGRNTAKTHLAAIFQKTDTRRQSELVRLLILSSGMLSSRREEGGFRR